MFINYSAVWTHPTIDSYRIPTGYANHDVIGLVRDILDGRDSTCPLEGAKAALEDGSLWDDEPETQEILEALHALISEHQKA